MGVVQLTEATLSRSREGQSAFQTSPGPMCEPAARILAMVQDKLRRARVLVAKGLTVREAATRLKVGNTALYKALHVA